MATTTTTGMKVRRAGAGLYAITAGSGARQLRYELARSMDDPNFWQLAPRSTAAWKALGEPERAPLFEKKREAEQRVRGIVEAMGRAA